MFNELGSSIKELSVFIISNIDVIIISLHALAIFCILLAKFVAPLNGLLLYGKNLERLDLSEPRQQNVFGLFVRLINLFVRLTVPKSFFLHFYIVYILANAGTILALFSIPTFMKKYQENIIVETLLQKITTRVLSSDEYKNLHIILCLITTQSIRRLIESIFITKFSTSAKINISHYIVGHLFYILIVLTTFLGLVPYYMKGFHLRSIKITNADFWLIFIFLYLSYKQFACHLYLSNLVKYTIPDFKLVSCPHYFFEIFLYLIILILSLKSGQFSSIQLQYLIAWIFVLINLSTSALDTYSYYKSKDRENFTLKWAIIPYLL